MPLVLTAKYRTDDGHRTVPIASVEPGMFAHEIAAILKQCPSTVAYLAAYVTTPELLHHTPAQCVPVAKGRLETIEIDEVPSEVRLFGVLSKRLEELQTLHSD